MGKIKKEKSEDTGDANVTQEETEMSYEEKLQNVSIIASPMASKKLAKKCYKLIKKGTFIYI